MKKFRPHHRIITLYLPKKNNKKEAESIPVKDYTGLAFVSEVRNYSYSDILNQVL